MAKHYVDPGSKKTYCTRNSNQLTTKINEVTCKDCRKIYWKQRSSILRDLLDKEGKK